MNSGDLYGGRFHRHFIQSAFLASSSRHSRDSTVVPPSPDRNDGFGQLVIPRLSPSCNNPTTCLIRDNCQETPTGAWWNYTGASRAERLPKVLGSELRYVCGAPSRDTDEPPPETFWEGDGMQRTSGPGVSTVFTGSKKGSPAFLRVFRGGIHVATKASRMRLWRTQRLQDGREAGWTMKRTCSLGPRLLRPDFVSGGPSRREASALPIIREPAVTRVGREEAEGS